MERINIQEALQEVGGVKRLAILLSVTKTTIYRWVKDKADLPEIYVYRLQSTRTPKRKRA
jgi:DNA-binding transcriptional regulator YdaS (Cro superfamily)